MQSLCQTPVQHQRQSSRRRNRRSDGMGTLACFTEEVTSTLNGVYAVYKSITSPPPPPPSPLPPSRPQLRDWPLRAVHKPDIILSSIISHKSSSSAVPFPDVVNLHLQKYFTFQGWGPRNASLRNRVILTSFVLSCKVTGLVFILYILSNSTSFYITTQSRILVFGLFRGRLG